MFIRVNLPAPFSPTSAWISTTPTVRDIPLRTRWPPYSLVIPRSSRTGLVVDFADKEEVGVALLLVVLVQRDGVSGREALHVLLHRRGVLVVGLLLHRVDQQVGHRPDREHHLGDRPGREVAGHPVLGDDLPILRADVFHVPRLLR